MEKFEKVDIIKQANIYFDGKVTSRSIIFPNGEKKTLGIMQAGEYEFNTEDKELMEILSGSLEVNIEGENTWIPVRGGESFYVPANSSFKMKVNEVTDYCCSFIKG